MSDELRFVKKGDVLPADVDGVDADGNRRSLGDVLARHERALVYFYPFDARDAAPETWRRLEQVRDFLEDENVGVIGVRGPVDATRNAPYAGHPFPVVEDPNYRIGQAVGVLGGGTGDQIGIEDVPRALVVVDHEGHVLSAARGDGMDVLADVLPDVVEELHHKGESGSGV